ncbi:MAG TPA: carboxyltransferase domain-containing protein [Acidimicrobiales bacterium]|nr:carboxyltransferase domain-containing protein [Acidimicrobiales bacterium]
MSGTPPGRRVGTSGLLLEVADPPAAAAATRALAARAGASLAEVVPGADTVLVLAAGPADLALLRPLLHGLADPAGVPPPVAAATGVIEIPVRYDGADLEAVAAATGLGVDGVVAAHAGGTYRGAFSGFAPGFCYLEGLPAALHLPRLPEPRPAVPAGSVAVADRYSAVYPRATPGGWRLLGRTDAALWDSTREPPALLRPGVAVRFVPVG